MKASREMIMAELKRMDPHLKPGSEGFRIAAILLGAAMVGVSEKKVADLLEETPAFVKKTFKQATSRQLFRNGKIEHSGWFDEEGGGVAFWLDVAMVQGLVKRSSRLK